MGGYVRNMITSKIELDDLTAFITTLPSLPLGKFKHLLGYCVLGTVTVMGAVLADGASMPAACPAVCTLIVNVVRMDE